MLSRAVVALVLLFGGYKAWEHFSRTPPPPLKEIPYIVVYGRESCGYTQRMNRNLDEAQLPYEFQSVDDPAVADVLHARMQASGLDVQRYLLPVVDANGEISVRPDFDEVRAQFFDRP
jgi:glutaredoxin